MTILGGSRIQASDLTPQYAFVTQLTQQSGWTAGVLTTVTFDDTDTADTLGIHDPVTLNSRLVIGKKLGWWRVQANVPFNGGTGVTVQRVQITKNGTAVTGSWASHVGTTVIASVLTPVVYIQATVSTDYIEVQGSTDATGGTLGTRVSAQIRPSITAEWVSP